MKSPVTEVRMKASGLLNRPLVFGDGISSTVAMSDAADGRNRVAGGILAIE